MRRSAGSANVPAGKLLPTPVEDVGALKVSKNFDGAVRHGIGVMERCEMVGDDLGEDIYCLLRASMLGH